MGARGCRWERPTVVLGSSIVPRRERSATRAGMLRPAASSNKKPAARIQGNRGLVIDKLGFLVRFWELKGRHATLGQPLSAREQVELLSLMQLVTGDFRMPEPGSCARPANALPAQLIGEGTILPVEVRHVCAAALLVASSKSMSPSERVIIRTADAVSGVEFALPCSVAWVYDASPCIMAVVVDGIPARTEFAAMSERGGGGGVSVGASVLSMGRQVRLVG